MQPIRLSGAALLAALAAAAPAAAQAPVPTTTPVAPVPTATPAPGPVAGSLTAKVEGVHKVDGKLLGLKGQRVRVKGRLKPAMPGQNVRVILSQRGKTLRSVRVPVRSSGRFSTKLRLARKGKLVVRAIHRRSSKIKRAAAKKVKLRSYKAAFGYGAAGTLVRLFQRELHQMRYSVNKTGVYDDATGRAVMAYRKVNGLPRSYSNSGHIVRQVLRGKGMYEVRHPGLGKHVEADISQQILALADGDRLVRVLHTSSGAPSTPTVLGTYRFYSQTIGTNSVGMVHSSYFIRGYAIHGYPSVPPYNASHGCLRIPIPDAYGVFKWIDIGDAIRVEA